MPPKVRISKEKILETSLKMIIDEGYQAVNIKSVAQKLGCSTQPVSWHFGNMDNFREELLNTAVLYANKKIVLYIWGRVVFIIEVVFPRCLQIKAIRN